MFDTINGIPVHPLVVHAVVVLLPLSVLGTIAIVVRPSWRRPYGPLVVASALFATILCPVATSSGEGLQERVGDTGEHAELGESLVWFSLVLLVTSAVLVWLDRRDHGKESSAPSSRPGLLRAVAIVAVIAALATAVQVYRVGDSGAREAWGGSGSRSATG